MKKILYAFVIIGWFYPQQPARSESIKKVSKEKSFFYTCSMHPFIHLNHPGNCPICHMTLIKKYVDGNETSGKKIETSEVEGRKDIQIDQTTLSSSGATLFKVENKNVIFTIKAFGKALSSSRFALQVSEVDMPLIRSGLTVKLKSPSNSFHDFEGKVTTIDSLLEPMGKTIRVEGNFASKNIRAESTLIAFIEIPKENIIAIPEDAILHHESTDYVFLYDEKSATLKPKKIEVGLIGNGYAEITSGLAQMQVITRGANFLLDSESRMQFSYDQKNN